MTSNKELSISKLQLEINDFSNYSGYTEETINNLIIIILKDIQTHENLTDYLDKLFSETKSAKLSFVSRMMKYFSQAVKE